MKHPYRKQTSQGFALLEALVAILIFSIGILALMGLQANAINSASENKYRSEAVDLAEHAISMMRVQGGSGLTTRWQAGGEWYEHWAAAYVAARLPNATGNCKPTITINSERIVTITVKWRAPQVDDAAAGANCREFQVITQIAEQS